MYGLRYVYTWEALNQKLYYYSEYKFWIQINLLSKMYYVKYTFLNRDFRKWTMLTVFGFQVSD